jgi:hypothetical protein
MLQHDNMNRLIIGNGEIENLILEFLKFENSFLLIDPTGDVARATAHRVPTRNIQQAMYFDPSESNHPPAANVLENIPESRRQAITEMLCAYFDVIFPGGQDTLTRTYARPILAAAIRLLLDNKRTTLLHLARVLNDTDYRELLLKHCSDPVVRETCDAIDDKENSNATAYLRSNFRSLFMSPTIRNVIGQENSTLGAQIIIANLDRKKIGDNTARLLGGLLIAHSSAPTYIVDFPFFAYEGFPLSQERFTMQVEFLDQLPPKLAPQLLGTDELYVFRTNKRDAEELIVQLGVNNIRQLTEDLHPNQARTRSSLIEVPTLPTIAGSFRRLKKRTRARNVRPRLNVEANIKIMLG